MLQEVAAARHILIVCGDTEIDGYAFCLGLEEFENFNKGRGNDWNVAPPVNYIIRGSIFRPSFSTGKKPSRSLDICSLGELMDMYHTHKATRHHDKVYALLGMCSDDLTIVGLSPDYSIPWENVLQLVMKHLLGKTISVKTWGGDLEFVTIKTKGCILGKVKFRAMTQEKGGIGINLWSKGETFWWKIRTSGKSIQKGDLVCLLQGASAPSIVRPHDDFLEIIMIAAARLPEGFFAGREGCTFNREFLLVWDWEISSNPFPLSENINYKVLLQTRTGVSNRSVSTKDRVDAAIRTWNMALMLADVREDEPDDKAAKKLEAAIWRYDAALKIEQCPIKGSLEVTLMRNRFHNVARQLLWKREADVDAYLEGNQSGETPLPLAAANVGLKDEDDGTHCYGRHSYGR